MNRYFLIAALLFGFIFFPLMSKSVGCKLHGGAPAFATNTATGSDDFVCARGAK